MRKRIRRKIEKVLGDYIQHEHLINSSHTPQITSSGLLQYRDSASLKTCAVDGELPLPPQEIRMGYGEDDDYNSSSQRTGRAIRDVVERYRVPVDNGARWLDWGCASSRVMRNFRDLADGVEIWGADQDAKCIAWNKVNLSPPFKYVTCNCWPHLPFEDRWFDFLYGISVFTHITEFIDSWLCEIRRILKPGGYCLLTVHDEGTIECFRDRGSLPFWLEGKATLADISDHDVVSVRGGDWSRHFTIFSRDWMRKEWSDYFRVVEFISAFEHTQSAVILQKT